MTDGITRRAALGAIAAPAIISLARSARADTRTLKISHQFPGSNGEQGDFRDRLCRKFAEEVEKRSQGALKFEIYPNSSLMKTFAQFDALKKGALDLGLYPTTYAGGEIPEMNITFMPAVVTSYEQAYRWKTAPIEPRSSDAGRKRDGEQRV
jgi:TRAP-type C4-dicarboxylate transport system substrate-binding protein